MSENKNIRNQLAEFFRYIRNEFSARERNSLERELQRDPFADEALEGLSSMSESLAIEDLKELNKRIRKRTATKSRSLIFRIAGIVVLLIGISVVLVLTVVKKPDNQVALNSPEPKTFEIKKSQPVIEPDSRENVIYDRAREEKKSIKSDERTDTEEAAQRTDSIEPSEKISKDNVVSETKVTPSKEEAFHELKVSAPTAALAGRKAETDQSDSALSEVVVIGYGTKKTDAGEEEFSDHIYPQPVTGKSKFNEYVTNNLHRPDTDAGKKEVVVLSFVVRTSGEIDSIRIIRSPGKEFSDEAIRVLMSGPAWKAAEENGKPVEEDVRLRIVFR